MLFLAGFVAGGVFQRFVSLDTLFINLGIRAPLSVPDSDFIALSDTARFANDEAVFVGLVLGQSNAASQGATAAGNIPDVFQYWKGKVYEAEDPLLGTTGQGGSIWMRLGERLLETHKSVMWMPVAIGQTGIADWLPSGGRYHRYLADALESIQNMQYPVDAVFWLQGETDAKERVSEDAYHESLLELIESIRGSLPDVPIYLAKATRCRTRPAYTPVRNAVDRAVRELPLVEAGIDLDKLGLEYRFDGCHLTDEGLEEAAKRWLGVLSSD